MDAVALTTAVTLLANAAAARLSAEELAVLSAALSQCADALALIAAQRALQESRAAGCAPAAPGRDSPASPGPCAAETGGTDTPPDGRTR